jgi:hypothetical protein
LSEVSRLRFDTAVDDFKNLYSSRKDRINSHLESELQGFRQESGLWRVGEQQRIEEFFRSMVIEAADLKQSSNAFVMKLERNWEENLVASLSREFS